MIIYLHCMKKTISYCIWNFNIFYELSYDFFYIWSDVLKMLCADQLNTESAILWIIPES